LSAVKGHTDVIAVLLATGAEIGAKDFDGATALDEALRNRHTKTVEALMARGAQLGSATQLRDAVLRGQADVVALLLDKGVDGKPYLHDAALKGHQTIAELLIKHGADVNGRNKTGATPLHDAALAGQRRVPRCF